MPVDIQNYNPMYVADPVDKPTKYVVTAREWSDLWRLISLQTNNTSEAMKILLDKLKDELWSTTAAAFIKSAELAAGSGDTVALQLAWLNAAKASKEYVDQTAQNFLLGILPPGSVSDNILSNNANDIKQRFAQHLNDIVTEASANKILKLNGDAKLPADITGNAAKVNNVYFRNNNGALEWSADNVTWNGAGGGIDFEFGLPLF